MCVSFYLPEKYLPDENWKHAWLARKILPRKESSKTATTHTWIYQTWFILREAGVDCNLVTQLPKEGIVIALSGSFSSLLDPTLSLKNLFLIDIVADGLPHPAAHLHLVQNKAHAKRLPHSLFISHWPQSGLIPRDPDRGTCFEIASFFGHHKNLAPELCSIKLHDECGMNFELRSVDHWHDYSDVDAVIAIRDFSKAHQLHKPATKLYNAWLAGVPFIGGRDSAYVADGNPGIDYLVATSPEEVIQHLKRLKEDPILRTTLVQNGLQSGKKFTREATLARWCQLVQTTLPALAAQWQKKSALQRHCFFMKQKLICCADRYLRS